MLIKELEKFLNERNLPVNTILTPSNKELIIQMAFLYEISLSDLEKCLLWSLTDENTLDVEEFKDACHDLFKSNNRMNKNKFIPDNRLNKEEQLIQTLENITPQQLLMELSSGLKVSDQDLRLVNSIKKEYNLPTPVMNVLIHFVLLQTNMKLSKNYLDKIASHWSRAGLKTTKEAMEFAKKQTKVISTNKEVAEIKLKAIEEAMLSGITDEKLGKFVRNMFSQ